MKLKLFKQSEGYCGPACLKMLLSFYGINKSENYLAKLTKATRKKGCAEKNIVKAAKKLGFNAYLKKHSSVKEIKELAKKGIFPIVAWTSPEEGGHYSVVVGFKGKNILIADPHFGKIKKHAIKWFDKRWKEIGKFRTLREIIIIQK